jgi:hypothetical protein
VTDRAGDKGVNRETVEILRGEVRTLLAFEESRAGSLTARGSGLAGFVGLALPLAGVLAQSLPAHGWERDLAIGLAVPGFLALLAAIAIAVHGVLIPSEAVMFDLAEVERYPTYEFIRQDPLMVDGRFLRGEVQTLGAERRKNDSKAAALRRAYVALTIALAFVMGQGILLVASRA